MVTLKFHSDVIITLNNDQDSAVRIISFPMIINMYIMYNVRTVKNLRTLKYVEHIEALLNY